MASESVLVIGLGEVGRPLYEILSECFEAVYGYDRDSSRTIDRLDSIPRGVDVMHVTFPYPGFESFVSSVISYLSCFDPGLVIIHSSVTPGTTRAIQSRTDAGVVYSPVRGKHPHLRDHLLFWPKWVSGVRRGAVERAREHLERAGFRVRVASDPESLELAKLWETVYRAVMIASWQEVHRIARKVGADIGVVAEFVSEVHEVLRDRPVYYPDVIGGHCL
ncbi:MAG: GDP-mannose dehydrogenase, partial [Thaumarchaeota archaeon]